jgi:glycosyltransferase involved in cell wall biosynthesis
LDKIKIAYIRSKFWFNLKAGGSISHTIGILKGFVNNNCEVKVISNEKFIGIDDFAYEIIKPKIFVKNFLILGELLYNFYSKPKFRKHISDFNPDHIYYRHSSHNFSIMQIAKKLNIPVILEYNGNPKKIFLNIKKNPIKKILNKLILEPLYNKINLFNFKNAFLIVVVSEPLKKDLTNIGINPDKILVTPNGVDIKKFNNDSINKNKKENIKKKWGLNKFSDIVGFIGTFGEWHGIPQLVSAIKKINSDHKNLNIGFILVGNGILKEFAENNLKKFENVIFTGIVPYSEIEYYIDVCDIVVSPHCYPKDGSVFFGSPTKLFEYMAMGKGIVASNLGQIGKILEHEGTAILTEPDNIDELAEGIIKLVKDKELRNNLGQKAKRQAYAKYTWDSNVRKIIDKVNKK